jgi:hypothetical protein
MEPFHAVAGIAGRSHAGDLAHSALPGAPVLPVSPARSWRHRNALRPLRAAKRTLWTPLRGRFANVRGPATIRARIVEWRE